MCLRTPPATAVGKRTIHNRRMKYEEGIDYSDGWFPEVLGYFVCPLRLQMQVPANVVAQDLLIKSEVETAVSMLGAINAKRQRGEMTMEKAKQLGADLLGSCSTELKDISGPIQRKVSMWFCMAARM